MTRTTRYPIVLSLVAQSAVDVLDEVVQLFDQALSARESRARHKLADALAERAKRSEDKLALAEEILPVLADPTIADEEVGALLRNRIGMSRLRAFIVVIRRPYGSKRLSARGASAVHGMSRSRRSLGWWRA